MVNDLPKSILKTALSSNNDKPLSKVTFKGNKTTQNSLTEIFSTQTQISEIKLRLLSLVESWHESPSLISRASNFWGKLPMWLKIVSGIVLFGGLITVGVLLHMVVLIVVGSVGAAVSIGGGFLLENHYNTNKRSLESLQNNVADLADVLESTINELDKVREQLEEEFEKFVRENKKFAENISELKNEMDELSEQVKQLSTTNEELTETQEKLTEMTQEFEEQNETLKQEVDSLGEVKTALESQVGELELTSATLAGVVKTFSDACIKDEIDRAAFQTRLKNFLADGSTKFDSIADRICKAEEELTKALDKLAHSNDSYNGLLARHEAQVVLLEKIISAANKPAAPISVPQPVISGEDNPDGGINRPAADVPASHENMKKWQLAGNNSHFFGVLARNKGNKNTKDAPDAIGALGPIRSFYLRSTPGAGQ